MFIYKSLCYIRFIVLYISTLLSMFTEPMSINPSSSYSLSNNESTVDHTSGTQINPKNLSQNSLLFFTRIKSGTSESLVQIIQSSFAVVCSSVLKNTATSKPLPIYRSRSINVKSYDLLYSQHKIYTTVSLFNMEKSYDSMQSATYYMETASAPYHTMVTTLAKAVETTPYSDVVISFYDTKSYNSTSFITGHKMTQTINRTLSFIVHPTSESIPPSKYLNQSSSSNPLNKIRYSTSVVFKYVNFTELNCTYFNNTGFNKEVYNITWNKKCKVIEGPPWWEDQNIYFGGGGLIFLIINILIIKTLCAFCSKYSGEYIPPRHLLPRRKRKKEPWVLRHIDNFPNITDVEPPTK